MVDLELKKNGKRFRDIRAREVGLREYLEGKKLDEKNVEMRVYEYNASKGREFFISFEDFGQEILVGFLRLRFGNKSHRKEIGVGSAIVRELHVYGQEVGIGKSVKRKARCGKLQHLGYGKRLLEKAEEIALGAEKKKMVIISGIGVREYYKKFRYSLEGRYMVKKLV